MFLDIYSPLRFPEKYLPRKTRLVHQSGRSVLQLIQCTQHSDFRVLITLKTTSEHSHHQSRAHYDDFKIQCAQVGMSFSPFLYMFDICILGKFWNIATFLKPGGSLVYTQYEWATAVFGTWNGMV